MASSRAGQKNVSRRFFWMMIAIAAVIALYTAGWHYAASYLLERSGTALAEINRDGNRAVCETPSVHGYPFRIGLYCNATYMERGAEGISVSTGAFRSATQVYDPRRVVAEVDGPARLTLRGLMPLDVDWQALRASTLLAQPLPERVSLEARKVRAVADMPGPDGPPAFTADALELHLRPQGEDLDAAVRFEALEPGRFLIGNDTVPPVSGVVDVTVAKGVARLQSGNAAVRGLSFAVRQMEVRLASGARLAAAGTVSVGDDGLLDASLSLDATRVGELAPLFAAAFPEAGDQIQAVLASLSKVGEIAALPVKIVKGQVSVGFIRLGTIPPL